MATVYIVRHGHIEGRGRFIGQADVPLSALGHEQAAKLGFLLREVRFDVCLCSPLLRALETARHIIEANEFFGPPHEESETAGLKKTAGRAATEVEGSGKTGESGKAGESATTGVTGKAGDSGKAGNVCRTGASSVPSEIGEAEKKQRHGKSGETPAPRNIGTYTKNMRSGEGGFGNVCCRQVKKTLSDRYGAPACLTVISALMEISLGAWEGMSKEEVMVAYPRLWEERGHAPALVAPPRGENYLMVHERLRSVFKLLAETGVEKNILVVAHRSVNQVLAGVLSQFPLDRWTDIAMPYGSVTLCPLRQQVLRGYSTPGSIETEKTTGNGEAE